ncbi:ketoacyl-synthetase C-terminal extension domain-containing protein [Kutzneria kofuensis]|uniref:ketoacyl-synthetase C-terminal extension domain-containing protein n=1 Tax=Kutzneria kofuensis TaxID=103725 RepID=UPI0031E7BEE8
MVNDHPRRAGISSFGISGTNAHIIIEQPPATEPVEVGPADQPWILTARTPDALQAHAQQLTTINANPAAIAHALNTRTRFDHRAIITSDHKATLHALATGQPSPSSPRPTSSPAKPPTCSPDKAANAPAQEANSTKPTPSSPPPSTPPAPPNYATSCSATQTD